MSLVGFKGRNHPQQTGKRGANPKVDDRATPPELFDPLNERFRFTIDVAASAHNTKCERFYSIEDNGLEQSWAGERVWCNPPYSDIRPWVAKAWGSCAELVVMLVPANRTEQAWWQDLIEPFRDTADTADKGVLEAIVLKQRNGPTGTARLAFMDRWGRVANMREGL